LIQIKLLGRYGSGSIKQAGASHISQHPTAVKGTPTLPAFSDAQAAISPDCDQMPALGQMPSNSFGQLSKAKVLSVRARPEIGS
jgi:hypothetical protein